MAYTNVGCICIHSAALSYAFVEAGLTLTQSVRHSIQLQSGTATDCNWTPTYMGQSSPGFSLPISMIGDDFSKPWFQGKPERRRRAAMAKHRSTQLSSRCTFMHPIAVGWQVKKQTGNWSFLQKMKTCSHRIETLLWQRMIVQPAVRQLALSLWLLPGEEKREKEDWEMARILCSITMPVTSLMILDENINA